MNTFAPTFSYGFFLPPEFQVQGDEQFVQELIAARERLTSSLLNIREIATYETAELMTGQQWFSTTPASQPRQTRASFRKVFDMVAANGGNIAAGATVSTPHGIVGLTICTRIFGSATSVTPTYLPLPYASATANKNIEIWADAVNVNIINGAGQPALSQCYITLEFLRQ